MISHHTQSQEKITHTQYSFSGMIQVVFIHKPHNPEIFFGLPERLVIKAAPAYTYQVALAADAQRLFTVNHTTTLCYRPSFFKFFFKNSRSISN